MKLRDWFETYSIDRGRFSKKLGFDRTTVYCWERGTSRPTYEHLLKLTEATGGAVTIHDFIEHAEEIRQARIKKCEPSQEKK